LNAKEIRGKIKENEENTDINNKKALEKQFRTFVGLAFVIFFFRIMLER